MNNSKFESNNSQEANKINDLNNEFTVIISADDDEFDS